MVNTTDGDGGSSCSMENEFIHRHHWHEVRENQCSSTLVKHIKAPVHLSPLLLDSSLSPILYLARKCYQNEVDYRVLFNYCIAAYKALQYRNQVWSLVRRFDQPQKYKPFVSGCNLQGDLEIGSVREVNVRSGLPATTSTERLELLNDEEHILGMKIVAGDHRLKNYSSVVTLHPEIVDGRPGTMVIESFIVDVPEGNTKDETCYFVEALIKCNLKSLADVSERLALQDRTESIVQI